MVGEKDGNVSVTLLLSGLASDLGSPIDISLTITQEKSGKLASILPTLQGTFGLFKFTDLASHLI